MAINIRKCPAPNPTAVKLPAEIHMNGTLLSNLPKEAATTRYDIDPANRVWFQLPGGVRRKSVSFPDPISNTDTPVHHRFTLEEHPAPAGMTALQIDVTVTDASGGTRHCPTGMTLL